MRGNRRQKPIEQLQNKRGGRGEKRVQIPAVVPGVPVSAASAHAAELALQAGKLPNAPKGLRPYSRRVWRDYFTAFVAGMIDIRADWDLIHRWIWAVDYADQVRSVLSDHALQARLYERELTVDGDYVFVPAFPAIGLARGSTGQLVKHPWWNILSDLERWISRAEEHMGMTPLSRMRLGISKLEAERRAAALKGGNHERPRPQPMPV